MNKLFPGSHKLLACKFLLRDFLLDWLILCLGHHLLLLRQDHLNMTRGGHEWVDATVCPVGAATHLAGTLDHDVLDHQVVHLKTLGNNETNLQYELIYQ